MKGGSTMGHTLKDGRTPTMPEVRKLFPGVGKPGTPGSDAVIEVRRFVRKTKPKRV
jgi:hypothetical protein